MKKILIMEDEENMYLLLNILSYQNEMIVEHVNTLTKENTFLGTQQPSLNLLDNRLPEGLGRDFLTRRTPKDVSHL